MILKYLWFMMLTLCALQHESKGNSVCTTNAPSMHDIVFLIDGSGSIATNDFQQVKMWMLQVVDQLQPALLGPAMKPRIVIVQYSDTVQIELEQAVIQVSSAEMKVSVEAIKQLERGTQTYRALRFINSDVLPKTRPGSFKILITITDGQASDDRDPNAINNARRDFDVMLAIGVGDQVNLDQLKDLSHETEPIMINSFTSIANITESVAAASCSPASQAKTYVGFVIDDTSSMGEEISAVTEWIRDCSNGVNKACGESPTGGWLVVSFSDPGIGQVVGPTLDVRMIINALTNYIPNGGGDCPEMAMGGIEKLVNQIPNQSQENVCKIYFFSDATPKDSNRQGEVKALLQRKGCQFIPILTGCCGVCPSVCDSVSQDYCRDRVTDYVGSSTPRNEPPGAMIGTGRRPYSFFSLAEDTGSPGIISAPNSITAAQLKSILVTVAPTMGFGTWSAWVTGPCSVTCGQGITTRTRHCNDELRRKISNEMCPGPWKQTVTCLPGPSCQTRNSVCTTTTRSMLDVVFLIDGSRSIEGNDFQEVKQWILQVVDQLRPSLVGATMKPRIIIVQYSRSVQIEVEQTIQASSAEIKVTVEAITQMNSGTNTYSALRFINSDVVPKTRPGSVKILIAITDGQASDNRDADAINEARSNFDVMLAIGVGDQVNDDQLEDLSHKTEPIMINSFTSIGNITESVVEVSCAPPPINPIEGHVWGKWTATRCTKTCGGGSMILSRPCVDGSGRTVSATFCPGGASSGTGRMACNAVKCTPAHGWGKWSSSGCSQTCGGGTITYSRPCMDDSGQTVASSFCPGGSSNGYASMTCNTMKCRSVSSVCTATTRSMLDVVFLIDGSGSIEANDFQQVKQWILQVVDQLRPALVGATMKPRIIIVQYSSNVEIEIEQTIQASSAEIKVSVEAITQMDSSTNTYSALRFINSDVVPKTRPGSVKILIAITDGQASDNRDADAINEARSNFDVMLAIGVGDQVNDDQLKDLSHKSEPIMINSFTSIGNITDSVVEVSCASTSETTTEYVWGKWSSSGCSQTCGGGTITHTRPCMDGSQQIVSATFCRGGLSSGSATTRCNTMNCASGHKSDSVFRKRNKNEPLVASRT